MNKIKIACASALILLAAIPVAARPQNPESAPKGAVECCGSKECKSQDGKKECKKSDCKKSDCKKGDCKKGPKGKKGKKDAKGSKCKKSAQMRRDFTEREQAILADLNLNSDQQAQVSKLMTERKAKMESKMAKKEQARVSLEQKQQKDRAKAESECVKERKNYETKLQKILTPEQYAKYQAKQTEARQNAKASRKGPQCELKQGAAPKCEGQSCQGVGDLKKGPAPQRF